MKILPKTTKNGSKKAPRNDAELYNIESQQMYEKIMLLCNLYPMFQARF